MKKLSVNFRASPEEIWPVGVLAETQGQVYFEYDATFLTRGLNLSPLRLPYRQEMFTHQDREFGPLPGLFDDSLPDGWGLLLMDRHFRKLNLNPLTISPLERLAWLGTRTMGALTYHPPTEREADSDEICSLHELARQSAQIMAGTAREVLPQLLRAGGSAGGARPKVLVGVNDEQILAGADDLPEGYEHWIVKFAGPADLPDAGAVEYAYAQMAGAAGIELPATRLFQTAEGGRYFGVRRFDRTGNRRHHVHTFGNLIQANFRVPSADYKDLCQATQVLTLNHQDLLQAFRRMIFNILAHNRDDHVKNFAFMMDGVTGAWRLAPAYDLMPTRGPGGRHTMTIVGEGEQPRKRHVEQLAKQVGITLPEMEEIVQEVQTAVAAWPEYATRAGVSQASGQLIAKMLAVWD